MLLKRLSQILWARTEQTLSCPCLGMLKGGGILDIKTQPHAVKYQDCLRREQATEKVTEDSSWEVIAAPEPQAGGSVLRLAPSRLMARPTKGDSKP